LSTGVQAMAKKATKKQAVSPGEPTAPDWTFEESIAELEQLVGELEGGELSLDEALDRYQRGVQRLKQCQQQLEAAEQRITLLSGVDADGNPVTQPLEDASGDPAEESLEAKAAARASRRTAAGPSRRRAAAEDASDAGGVDDASRLF
ncbi:MAG: exodeoxyribonuclease VII small subunit, partial [Planctomycetota bacterium]